jgi:hypothetical protein
MIAPRLADAERSRRAHRRFVVALVNPQSSSHWPVSVVFRPPAAWPRRPTAVPGAPGARACVRRALCMRRVSLGIAAPSPESSQVTAPARGADPDQRAGIGPLPETMSTGPRRQRSNPPQERGSVMLSNRLVAMAGPTVVVSAIVGLGLAMPGLPAQAAASGAWEIQASTVSSTPGAVEPARGNEDRDINSLVFSGDAYDNEMGITSAGANENARQRTQADAASGLSTGIFLPEIGDDVLIAARRAFESQTKPHADGIIAILSEKPGAHQVLAGVVLAPSLTAPLGSTKGSLVGPGPVHTSTERSTTGNYLLPYIEQDN